MQMKTRPAIDSVRVNAGNEGQDEIDLVLFWRTSRTLSHPLGWIRSVK